MAKLEPGSVSNTVSRMRHRTVTVNGLDIFYREAGPVGAPTLVLLHGFPSASHQYAPLMARLADRVHVVAPDYPGFGHSSAPASSHTGGSFVYTFDHLAEITDAFLDAIKVDRFFVYVFDFKMATPTRQGLARICSPSSNPGQTGRRSTSWPRPCSVSTPPAANI